MLVDQVMVDRIIHLQKANPSKSDSSNFLTSELNTYFSKEEIEQRVSLLCQAMLDGKVAGRMLYTYYPIFLFFSKSYKDGRKIIFDQFEDESILRLFQKACVAFGLPSHLKKHGNSTRKVFRSLPSFKELQLEEVREGSVAIPESMEISVWHFLMSFQYLYPVSQENADSTIFPVIYKQKLWIIQNSELKFPQEFWEKLAASALKLGPFLENNKTELKKIKNTRNYSLEFSN
tara:strand:- start:12679 stop:13374 length:696 start_codon:yes stop_codon:yes gene_type:complete